MNEIPKKFLEAVREKKGRSGTSLTDHVKAMKTEITQLRAEGCTWRSIADGFSEYVLGGREQITEERMRKAARRAGVPARTFHKGKEKV